jgi:hypothetical protein
MNAKIKRIATIGSLLAATAAVSAHAADQTRFFEEQVQLTDSYVPDNRESATPAKGVGNNEPEAQLNWLAKQMRLTDGYTPPRAG